MRTSKVKQLLQRFKPWVLYLALFLVIYYSGILSGVSFWANQALLKTGAMNAKPEVESLQKKFNYDFTIRNLEDEEIDMASFKGKTIFINVWATWCGPCRVEMPSIQKLYEKTDKEKVVFIMLSVDQKEPEKTVRDFLAQKGYSFPVYLPGSSLTEQLQVRSIPTTFVISPEGKVVSKKTGAANYDTEAYQSFLEKL